VGVLQSPPFIYTMCSMYLVSVIYKKWFKREFENTENKEFLKKNIRYCIEESIKLWEWDHDIYLPTELETKHYNDKEELIHKSIEDVNIPAYTVRIKKATTPTHIGISPEIPKLLSKTKFVVKP